MVNCVFIAQAAAESMTVVAVAVVDLLTSDINRTDLNGTKPAKTIVKRRNIIRVKFMPVPAFDTVPR